MKEASSSGTATIRRVAFRSRRFTSRAGVVLAFAVVGTALATPRLSVSRAVAAANSARLSGAIVVDWNKELLHILATPGAQPATVHPTRSLAILHAAMYDAVVSINRADPPYLFSLDAPRGARADAAAAEAGRDTLAALYPSFRVALDQQLSRELHAIPNGPAKQQGTAVGRLAAAFILALRSGDGSSAAPTALPAGTQPGAYRSTPPAFAPAAFTHWSLVTPFVLQRAGQFRPAPPPALDSAAYARAIKEIQSLGQDGSTTRTAYQTVSAKFWAGPPWVSWNEIADSSALAHHSDLVHTARLFVLLNLSFADTVIALFETKYHYLVWRPITAIRDAAQDASPQWTPLLTTPSEPSYPGAHSALAEAAAAILSSFYGDRNRIKVTSDALPGAVLTFNSYSAAAVDTGLSRLWGGVHYRFDHRAGLRLGRDVAGFVLLQSRSGAFGLR